MTTPANVRLPHYQTFSESGLLSQNLNLDRHSLAQRIGVTQGGLVYCYVVATVEYAGGQLMQSGSGPNFQGGLITLCTCKGQMRAGKDMGAWIGTWIAGITGAPAGRQAEGFLFYLMRVARAFASHRDLWDWLSAHAPDAAKAKVADQNQLGDVYRPRDPCVDPYSPYAYFPPCPLHVHSGTAWHEDIDYYA